MSRVFKGICLVFSVFLLTGCTSSFRTEGAFLIWLDQPENGYVKKTRANGFSMSLKYLPPEYLAYMEMKGEDFETPRDGSAALDQFNGSRTFLFSIEHEESGVDISTYGVQNVTEFKRRVNELNFNIGDHLFLRYGTGKKSKPVLATYENVYEIGGKKSFYLVFPKEGEKEGVSDKIDIVFEDPFFDTGINHFVFQARHIDHSPTLQFIN